MDFLEAEFGRDTLVILALYIGVTVRAGKPVKMNVIHSIIDSFVPFFLVLCTVYMIEGLIGWWPGWVVPTKVLASVSGIAGWGGNYIVSGWKKDGETIEKKGVSSSLVTVVKKVRNLKK